jgi:hypothetical protein
MFAILSQNRPQVGADLMRRIQNREFSAIILVRDPSQPENRQWYDVVYFGSPFRQKVLDNYHAAENPEAGNVVYLANDAKK